MRISSVKKIVALVGVASMFLVGTADAVVAHDTSLTLAVNARRVSQAHGTLRFSGHIQSDSARCKNHRIVHLFRNDRWVTKDTTNATGHYAFAVPARIGKWKVKFNGFSGGVHPNEFFCRGSVSRVITVTA